AGLERSGIPALNLSMVLLALKCSGTKRYSHSNDLEDDGIALWTGLSKLPDQSVLHRFAQEFTPKMVDGLFLYMGRALKQLYHLNGSRVNVDFHNIPAYGDTGEKAWVPTRGKTMSCKRAMFVQDQETTMPILATTNFKGMKPSQAVLLAADVCEEIFGRSHLVMDSRVTTYAVLNDLDKRGFGFTTLRRRSQKMIERIESLPEESFDIVEMDNRRRAYRRVRVLDEKTGLKDYDGEVRQIAITDHGREKPTFLVTNDFESTVKEIITIYTWRWRVENNISENVDFFALDKLPSYLSIKVDVDLFFTLLGDNLYKMLAWEVEGHTRNKPETIFRKFIRKRADIRVEEDEIVVRFQNFKEQGHVRGLYESIKEHLEKRGIKTRYSWLGNKSVKYEFVEKEH
ncbi:MAG: transposase, partial [bacterium]